MSNEKDKARKHWEDRTSETNQTGSDAHAEHVTEAARVIVKSTKLRTDL